MTAPQAAANWQKRQIALLLAAYRQAWDAGAQNYRSTVATPRATATATATAPPTTPNVNRMRQALQPAIRSAARMAAQIALIVPTGVQIAAAGTLALAIRQQVLAFIAANAHRVAAGSYVAWAGEQAGYAEAAAADGLLLSWQLDPAVKHHCADCPSLAALPAMPLDRWPTLPGLGATACNVGCRCSMVAVPAPRKVLQFA